MATKRVAITLPYRLRGIFGRQHLALLGTLILVCIVAEVLNQTFFTLTNLVNVMRQVSITGIIACGMAMVMISGGIDLSVGMLVSVSGSLAAVLLKDGHGLGLALLAGIGVGVVVGLVNGVIVARTKVPPFIFTLGMMSVLQGFALLITKGWQITVGDAGSTFEGIGAGVVGFVPVPVVIFLLVIALCYVVLRFTKYGRHWYAIGGNEETAYLSGINVAAHKVAVYGAMGLLTGLAAIVLTSRIGAGLATMGAGYELQSIAAVVVGGVSLAGGRGNIFGAMLGVLLLGVISNALNLLDVVTYYQFIAVGAITGVAVIANQYTQRR